jgi:hypothetical protein
VVAAAVGAFGGAIVSTNVRRGHAGVEQQAVQESTASVKERGWYIEISTVVLAILFAEFADIAERIRHGFVMVILMRIVRKRNDSLKKRNPLVSSGNCMLLLLSLFLIKTKTKKVDNKNKQTRKKERKQQKNRLFCHSSPPPHCYSCVNCLTLSTTRSAIYLNESVTTTVV